MEFIKNEKILISTTSYKETAMEGYFCRNYENGYLAKRYIDSVEECFFPFIWKLEYIPFKNTLESRKFLLGKKIMSKNNNSRMFIIGSFDSMLTDAHWIYLTNISNPHSPTSLLKIFLFLDGTPIGERK